MPEDFGIDLGLDEAMEARIAHADFLTAVKDWGVTMGMINIPFARMGQSLLDNPNDKRNIEKIVEALPTGVEILIEHLNELYTLIQNNAIKVLGAPFAIHDEHNPDCDGTNSNCGHQDHFVEPPTE